MRLIFLERTLSDLRPWNIFHREVGESPVTGWRNPSFMENESMLNRVPLAMSESSEASRGYLPVT